MTEETTNPVVEEREAIARIALTADGVILHRYLRRQVESCRATPDSGALQRHEGARIFARELMVIMAEGVVASGGRADQPILSGRQQPVVAAGRHGTRRRVKLEPGDGWRPESDEPAAGGDAT